MGRRRWHDVVIYLSILALAVIGVVSIWGGTIRGWFEDEPPPAQVAPTPDTADPA